MRLKMFFIFFNIIVGFSFLIITIMPFILLGAEYSIVFFKNSWYFFLIFVLTIVSIYTLFLMYWKLFLLLENKNWDGVISYLENKVYIEKKLYLHLIKILANTYLIKSNIEGISKLEELIRKKKPKILKKMVLSISPPHLLTGDIKKMEIFFGEFVKKKGVRKANWVQFFYSFSLLLNNKKDEATKTLMALCNRNVSPILELLIIYTISPFTEIIETSKHSCIEFRKKKLLSKYTKLKMEHELEQINDNVVALVLNKFLKEAIQWLYKE